MELLDLVCGKFHEEAGIFKLLIVDSIMALFRVDFSGRGELADRQQQLAQMLSKLQKISEVTETSTAGTFSLNGRYEGKIPVSENYANCVLLLLLVQDVNKGLFLTFPHLISASKVLIRSSVTSV